MHSMIGLCHDMAEPYGGQMMCWHIDGTYNMTESSMVVKKGSNESDIKSWRNDV